VTQFGSAEAFVSANHGREWAPLPYVFPLVGSFDSSSAGYYVSHLVWYRGCARINYTAATVAGTTLTLAACSNLPLATASDAVNGRAAAPAWDTTRGVPGATSATSFRAWQAVFSGDTGDASAYAADIEAWATYIAETVHGMTFVTYSAEAHPDPDPATNGAALRVIAFATT
jgi:hypothetical protein